MWGAFKKSPGHSGQSSHGLGQYALVMFIKLQSKRGVTEILRGTKFQVLWLPEGPHLKEVGLQV